MEMYVGVASTVDNVIPEKFQTEGQIYFIRYEVDTEDSTIYTRSTVRCTKENFVQQALENKIQAFVYNSIDKEIEEELEKSGIKLYPGHTGSSSKAATSIF